MLANPAHSNRACFPSQLYALLQQVEDDGMASIVSWQPHGLAFKVHCKERFEQEVLPRWFNHSNYNSFQRQLNIYGFRRFREGRDKHAYYHQDFVRGEYRRIFNIDRNAIKGTEAQRPSVDSVHPDFYQRRVRVEDDPYGTTTANTTRMASISRLQPVSLSAPRSPMAPMLPRPESMTASPNLYDTHIQSYLRANRRVVGAAHATSFAARPISYNSTQTSLFPQRERFEIPRWPATTWNAAAILARTEPSHFARMEALLSPALRGSVVEEMIQAQALVGTLPRPPRREEPLVALARASRNVPSGNVPPASFRPEESWDLLVRQSLLHTRGAGW